MLLMSIITPCLNRAGLIVEAIESVQRQDHPAIEHIVVDGGSTDGTLELLRRYPHLRVFSERDRGIYDALNKGIRLARGQVIGFLNTDDTYEPGVFGSVARAFEEHPGAAAVVGGASIFRGDVHNERTTLAIFPGVAQHELLARSTHGAPVFNAWFFRKRLFDDLGVLDSSYLYVADREFLIRMASRNIPYASLGGTFVYHYRMHSGSYTLSGRDSGEAPYMFECRTLAERYLRLGSNDPEVVRRFKAWHNQITMEQALTAWRNRALHRAVAYVLAGLRYDLLGWPRVFEQHLATLRTRPADKAAAGG